MKMIAICAVALVMCTLSVQAQQPTTGQNKNNSKSKTMTQSPNKTGNTNYEGRQDSLNKPWDSLNIYPNRNDSTLQQQTAPQNGTMPKSSKSTMLNNNATTPRK